MDGDRRGRPRAPPGPVGPGPRYLDWVDTLARLRQHPEPCVLVTVVAAKGSVPRDPGAKLVVTAGEQHGTIGGGSLEFQAIRAARTLLERNAATPVLEEIPLGPALGQCCGGTATLLFEPFPGPTLTVHLYGAGHVGREIVHVLSGLPGLALRWLDPRADQFPPDPVPGVTAVPTPIPEADAAEAPPDAVHLVMTHSHDLDLRVVEAVLRRDRFRFLGLIGSATKRARFERRLQALDLDTARLVCPIGAAGIADKHPRAIAIAVAAQLIRLEA